MLTQITGPKLECIKKLLLTQIEINPIVAAMVKKVTPVSGLKIIRKTELKSYLYYIGKSTDTDAVVLKTRPLRFVKAQIDALETQLSESLPATSTARHSFVLIEHVKKQAGGTPLSLTEDDKLFIVSAGGDDKHRRFLLRNHRNATVSDVVDAIEKRLTTTAFNITPLAPNNIVIPLGTAQEIKVALAKLIDPFGEGLFPEDIHLSETHFKLGHGYKATLLNTSLILFGSIEFKIGVPGETGESGETEEPETPEEPETVTEGFGNNNIVILPTATLDPAKTYIITSVAGNLSTELTGVDTVASVVYPLVANTFAGDLSVTATDYDLSVANFSRRVIDIKIVDKVTGSTAFDVTWAASTLTAGNTVNRDTFITTGVTQSTNLTIKVNNVSYGATTTVGVPYMTALEQVINESALLGVLQVVPVGEEAYLRNLLATPIKISVLDNNVPVADLTDVLLNTNVPVDNETKLLYDGTEAQLERLPTNFFNGGAGQLILETASGILINSVEYEGSGDIANLYAQLFSTQTDLAIGGTTNWYVGIVNKVTRVVKVRVRLSSGKFDKYLVLAPAAEIPFPLQDVSYSDVKWATNIAKLNMTETIPAGHTLVINSGIYRPQDGEKVPSFAHLTEYTSWLSANYRNVIAITSATPVVDGGVEFSLDDATRIFAAPSNGGYSRYLNVIQFNANGEFVAVKHIDAAPLFDPLNAINDYPQVYKEVIGDRTIIAIADTEWGISSGEPSNQRWLRHATGMEFINTFKGYGVVDVTDITEPRFALKYQGNKYRYIQIADVASLPDTHIFVMGNSITLPVEQNLGTTKVSLHGSGSGTTNFSFSEVPSTAALEKVVNTFFFANTLLYDLAEDGLTCTVMNLTNDLQWIKLTNNQTNEIIAWFYLLPGSTPAEN